MEDKDMARLMKGLEQDIAGRELDEILEGADIEIDVESISQKAHWKLKKERNKMKMKRLIPILAASLALVCGVTTAYAKEISAFIQSLMGKSSVYSTVVEGEVYYLKDPVALGEGESLSKAIFSDQELELRFIVDPSNRPDVTINVNGTELEPHGFMGETDGMSLFFYSVGEAPLPSPTDTFEVIVGGKRYPIILSEADAVVDGGDIIEAEPNDIDWISMGYRKIDGGVQILTTIDDETLELHSLLIPEDDRIEESFEGMGGGSMHMKMMDLVGTDTEGNRFIYAYDPNDAGRPLTIFTSDAPVGKDIALKVPGIIIGDPNALEELPLSLPASGEKREVNRIIDLGLQSMELRTLERTSDTTARLEFLLNTKDTPHVRIRQVGLVSEQFESGELVWDNGACVMEVNLVEGVEEIILMAAYPSYFVDGDWTLRIR